MKRQLFKIQSIVIVFAIILSAFSPLGAIFTYAAPTHEIALTYEDGSLIPDSEKIKLMESEQLQLSYKLVDCSMPTGSYIKWQSDAPLVVSVSQEGLVRAHDSSKGAAIRLWIDNDVKSIAIVGPTLAKTMENLLLGDTINLDTMDTETIIANVRKNLSYVSSSVADYLCDALQKKLDELNTKIYVALYSKDGTILCYDVVEIIVTNSDQWYANYIPNGAFITNKDTLPSIVEVGGTLKLEGAITPLRLGYGVSWSLETPNALETGTDFATIDENGNITFLKAGTVTVVASPNAEEIVGKMLDYISLTLKAGENVDTSSIATILVRVMGLSVSPETVKSALDIIVYISKLTSNSASLISTVTKTVANYLLKASINDKYTFTIKDNIELNDFAVTASKTTLEEGQTAIASIINLDPAGSRLNSISWTSSDESVASVDSNGIIKARDAGGATSLTKKTATITATMDGISRSVDITVTGKVIAIPTDINIQGEDSIGIGEPVIFTANTYPTRYSFSGVTWGILSDDGVTVLYTNNNTVSNSVASISSTGVVTGLNGGEITIYAKIGNLESTQVVATKRVKVGIKTTGITINQGEFVSSVVPALSSFHSAYSTLSATVYPENASNKEVTWSVIYGDISVDQGGVVRPTGYSATYGLVEAKAHDGQVAYCYVSFVSTQVTGVTVDYTSLTLINGNLFTIEASVEPKGTIGIGKATFDDCVWLSSDENIAIVSGGTILAREAGEVDIICKTVDGGKSTICHVTVLPNKTNLQYAIKLYETGKINSENCTPDQWQRLTSAYNTAVEVNNIQIVSQALCDKSAQAIIDIYDEIGGYVNLYGIEITYNGVVAPSFLSNTVSTFSSYKNQTVQLGCNLIPNDAMYASITWKSSNENVTVSDTGLVTVQKNEAQFALITVTAVDYTGNTATDEIMVTFVNTPVTDVTFDNYTLNGNVYKTAKITATVAPTGTLGIGKATITNLVWTSSDESVAKVDQEGNVTFVGVGSAQIIATSYDGGKTATCNVVVTTNNDTLSNSISNVVNADLIEDDYTINSYNDLKSAYDNAILVLNNEQSTQESIDKAQKDLDTAFSNLVKLIKPQDVIIKLDGAEAPYYISKEVDIATSLMYQNNSVQLEARIIPLDTMYTSAVWTSSSSKISVDQTGKVTPTVNEACYSMITMTVTDERGHTASKSVIVSFARYPVDVVTISPDTLNVALEDSPVKLTAKCKNYTDILGKPQEYDASIQNVVWTSDNENAVSVDYTTGQLQYHDAGEAIITATAIDGGVTATCKVIVGGDKTALREAIEQVNEMKINVQDYTLETSTVYQDAYNKAVEIEQSTKYSQDEIDLATQNLLTALQNLSPYTHMTELNLLYNGQAAPVQISVKVPVYQMYTLASIDLSYNFAPADAMYKSITWTSTSSTIKVENGKVTPTANKACDSAIILTATDHYDNTIQKVVFVSFANTPVTGITIDKTEMTVNLGVEPQTITGTVLPTPNGIGVGGANITDILWFTSDEDVATVAGGVVTFVEAGTCTITAMSVNGGFTADCIVTVKSNKAKLNETYAMMKGLNLQAENYTDESWAVFAKAYKEAEDILATDNPKQRDIDAANTNLSEAYKNLVEYKKLKDVQITLNGVVVPDFYTVTVPITSKYTSQSVLFGYNVNPEDASVVSVEWSSTSPSIICNNGLCAPSENKASYAIITVKVTDYKGDSVTDNVVLCFANTPVTGINVDKTSLTGKVGDQQIVTANVLPTATVGIGGANITSILWNTSDSNIATVENGVVTMKKDGNCIIYATSVDGGYTANIPVKVYANKDNLQNICNVCDTLEQTKFTPASWNEYYPVYTATKAVLDSENPTQIEVDQAYENLVNAKLLLVSYVYIEKLDITYNSEEKDVFTVIVPEDSTYIITTADLSFKTDPENAMYVSSSWSSEGDVYVNINGVVVPSKNEPSIGKVKLKVVDDFGKEYTDEVTIMFVKVPATSITISPETYTSTIGGEDFTLTASVIGENGKKADFSDVVWKSSDEKIVTVNQNGVVHIVNGGKAKIIATTVVGDLVAECNIEITTDKSVLTNRINEIEARYTDTQEFTISSYQNLLSKLNDAKAVLNNVDASQEMIDNAVSSLNQAEKDLVKYIKPQYIQITRNGVAVEHAVSIPVKVYQSYYGQNVQLGYTFNSSDVMYNNVVWASDNKYVTVDQTGKVTNNSLAASVAAISVTATDDFGNTYVDAIFVTFVNTQVTGVSLNFTDVTCDVGLSGTLLATVAPTNVLGGSNATISDVAWISSDSSVMTVDSNGNVVALDAGTVTIYAITKDGGYVATCVFKIHANKTDLTNAVNDAKTLNQNNFTTDSYALFKTALDEAESVLNNEFAKIAEITTAIQNLETAKNNLKYVVGDYTDLKKAVEAFKELNPKKYTEASYNAVKTIVDSIDYTITVDKQSQIDEITNSIYNKINVLVATQNTLVEKAKGTNTVVDDDLKVIYGVDEGITSLDDYVNVEFGYIKVEKGEYGLGTGSKVKLYNESKDLVEEYTLVIFGDIDGDGYCDGCDSALISLMANFEIEMSDAQTLAADITNDGVVDSFDTAMANDAGVFLITVNQNRTIIK